MRIRTAAPTDYDAFATLAPELGPTWKVPSEQDWTSELAPNSLVAELEGQVIGYVMGTPAGARGYVHQLAVGPQNRRRGADKLLLHAMAERFRGSGCSEWQLNVEGHNASARALYERFGLRPLVRKCWVEIERANLGRVPGDPTVHGRVLDPADDVVTEQRFGLSPGSLHWYRKIEAVPVEAVDADGQRVGFGAFLAHQALVRPLVLYRTDALRALLSPLRALPASVRLAVEHEELVAALLAAGGTTANEEWQYVGSLDTRPDE
jgi:GNAT superfamily N-acetyltransferase